MAFCCSLFIFSWGFCLQKILVLFLSLELTLALSFVFLSLLFFASVLYKRLTTILWPVHPLFPTSMYHQKALSMIQGKYKYIGEFIFRQTEVNLTRLKRLSVWSK